MLSINIVSNAQKVWTLEECIRYALDNNLQIKRQEIQTEISKNNFNQSKYSILPNLVAGGGNVWGFGLYTNPYTNKLTNTPVISDNIYAQSTLVLFNGFQQLNTIKQNRYILDKSLQDFEKIKNDITMYVATAYLQILSDEENLIVAQQQVELSNQQTERMLKLFEVGSKSKGDLLVMQASEANDKFNYVTAKNNLNISYLTLSQLLEFKSPEGFTIYNPDSLSVDIVKKPTTVDDVYNEAVLKMPQIKSAEFDLLNNEKGLAIAKGQLSPQVSLSGNYSSGYSNEVKQIKTVPSAPDTIGFDAVTNVPVITPGYNYTTSNYSFIDQIRNNAYKSLTFNINVPIFNRFQTRTNISNAKLKLADAQYNLEITKKDLYKEIQKAYMDAVSELEKYNSANESVNSNSEAFKYSQQKYDVGIMSAVDYNLAKTNLIKAKSDLIQSKYTYIFKMKILDFYRGLPIVL